MSSHAVADSSFVSQNRRRTSRARLKDAAAAIDAANHVSSDDFVKQYLKPSQGWTTWTHPTSKDVYKLDLCNSENLTNDDLDACFNLIDSTSGKDYRASPAGWHPAAKRKEMRSPGLRYILLKKLSDDSSGALGAFTSFMPTFEDGQPVLYCYEIHLVSELQGTGLGSALMQYVFNVASNIPDVEKVMLTCFVSNAGGRTFYGKLGFTVDESSPGNRKLRGGKIVAADYVILSRLAKRLR